MNTWLEQAIVADKNKQMNIAFDCYQQALQESPNDLQVLMLFGEHLYSNMQYGKALDLFVRAHHVVGEDQYNTKQDLADFIFEKYYQPYYSDLTSQYEKNVELFSLYQHNYLDEFPDFDHIAISYIKRDQDNYYPYYKEEGRFGRLISTCESASNWDLLSNDCVLCCNIFSQTSLDIVDNRTESADWVDNIRVPIYLLWEDKVTMYLHMQLQDYTNILKALRFVFFSEATSKKFSDFFLNHQSICFNKLIGLSNYNEIVKIIQELSNQRSSKAIEQKNALNKLAHRYTPQYYKKLFSGKSQKVKILFYTSLFTQVVQYATRDFVQGFRELGLECDILIEESFIHRCTNEVLTERILSFQPDVVFRINFFRWNFGGIPENLMFLSWIQDPLPEVLLSKEYVLKIQKNDYILVYDSQINKMQAVGYPIERMKLQTQMLNNEVYYPHQLTSTESRKYSSDVAFAANYHEVEDDIADILIQLGKELSEQLEVFNQKIFYKFILCFFDYLKMTVDSGSTTGSQADYEKNIREMASIWKLDLPEEVFKYLAYQLYNRTTYVLGRRAIVHRIILAKLDLALWGNGWERNLIFRQYSRGRLANGDELAKMYSVTKIIIAMTGSVTEHFRVWESLACGALPFVQYVPPEEDRHDIRRFPDYDKFVVIFKDYQDLINKLQYYLSHEEERKKMVNYGQKFISNKMTSSKAAQECLEWIAQDLHR